MQMDCPKRESGDERRLAIAQAARDIIVEKGLEGLRTRDIAARVGINIATLHYHVPSKEELVRLVAESVKAEFREQGTRRSRDGLTGLQVLRMESEDAMETMLDAPDRFTVMAELIERSRRDPQIADIMRPMVDFWPKMLADVFAQGARDGSLRADIDPDAAARIFMGTVVGWRVADPSRQQLADVFSELERAFRAPAHKEVH